MEKYLPILKNSSFFKGLTDDEILSILHCVEATAVSKERDSYIFRAAMSTEISKLQKEGFIKTNRNHFELTVSKDADSRTKM